MSILLCTELKIKVCARTRPAAEQMSGPAYLRCGQPGSLGPTVETSCPSSSGCCPLLFLVVLWSSHQPKPQWPRPSLGFPGSLAWDSPWLTKVMCYVTGGRPWCSMALYPLPPTQNQETELSVSKCPSDSRSARKSTGSASSGRQGGGAHTGCVPTGHQEPLRTSHSLPF